MKHTIKIQEEFADAVRLGDKTFEVRENDRGYQKGDIIQFRVVDGLFECSYHHLNDELYEITYVLSGWGIKEGFVVFGIKKVRDKE